MPPELSTVRSDQLVEALRRELTDARQQQAATAEVLAIRTRELADALEQQTATADVLKVISGSAFDLGAVLAALAESAARLCAGDDVSIFRVDGSNLLRVAHCGPMRAPSGYVIPAIPGTVAGRSVLDRRPIHVADLQTETQAYPEGSAIARELGHRTILVVPLLREGSAIGAITLRRTRVEPFSEKQVALVTTFADQAVIAIENTRLFEAEKTRTRELTERTAELTETLAYQTATSDVLSVISRSPSNLEPVLDVIIKTAVRLCQAEFADFRLLRDGSYHVVATTTGDARRDKEHMASPIAPGRGSVAGRVALERRTIHVPDVRADPEYTYVPRPKFPAMRSILGVPLLRDGAVIGVIVLFRSVPKPFTQRQINLVTTFADQALIAIENTRLFEEVQARTRDLTQALEYQTGTSDVLGVISRSKFDLQPIIDTIVETATRLCRAKRGTLMKFEDGRFRLLPTSGAMAGPVTKRLIDRLLPIDRGSVAGRVAIERRTVHIRDLQADPEFTLMRGTEGDDRRTCLGVPLIASNSLLGALVLQRTEVLPFTHEQIKLVETFADQAVIAFENTRLFEEIVRKSRELEIASQHKSQFVANMSHELRTPLAAMLGYAELLQEGIYGALPDKSLPILTRIRANGKHLLSLINTVLDISKIEAGQFKLNLAEYALASIVETVVDATESLAAAKKLAFKTEVAKGLPYGLGDEQRLTQVLLNLVGNAIKFTDAGEVRIAAGTANGRFTVLVSDTGPGIPAEEREHVFEKFRQLDNSNTRAKGGTGLGLAIAKEIVAMHGGRIWVESTFGEGSTFCMELPVRAGTTTGAQ